jgi:anti-sigma B factor antagonist
MIAPQPQDDPSCFRIEVHPERKVVRVVPVGDLDLPRVDALKAQLRELRESGFDRIVLDLRQLTFMDTTAVALILSEDHLARVDDHGFELIAGSHAIQRILEICGVVNHLRFFQHA